MADRIGPLVGRRASVGRTTRASSPNVDDRDRIAAPEAVDELAQRILDQLEPVAVGHRARGVDDERERARRVAPVRTTRGP